MRQSVLVAGGCGFIGSHVVREALQRGYDVVSLDALTYAATRRTLADVDTMSRHRFVHGSIGDRDLVSALLNEHQPVAVLNLAASTHVDRSIDDPADFVRTNVYGVFELLEAIRAYFGTLEPDDRKQFRFLQVSTDEVFGSIAQGAATEEAPHRPSSPYSATKAAADDLVCGWSVTYGLPVLISHCTNNYGPYQFPEKLIPHLIVRALSEMALPVYGDGMQQREWLHVRDHVDGLFAVLERGQPGARYNLGSGVRCTNLELVNALCRALDERLPRSDGRPYAQAIAFVEDRPGHDRRYSLDVSAACRDVGFRPRVALKDGLAETVEWYIRRSDWWRPLLKDRYSLQRLGVGDDLGVSCDAA